MKFFLYLRQRFVGPAGGEQSKDGVAHQGQVSQGIGIASARFIFAHDDVSFPMIADFNPAPVTSDQAPPLLIGVLVRRVAGKIVACFCGAKVGALDGALGTKGQECSGKRKVRFHRFDGKGVQTPDFYAPASGLGVGKKGVLFNPLSPSALASRWG